MNFTQVPLDTVFASSEVPVSFCQPQGGTWYKYWVFGVEPQGHFWILTSYTHKFWWANSLALGTIWKPVIWPSSLSKSWITELAYAYLRVGCVGLNFQYFSAVSGTGPESACIIIGTGSQRLGIKFEEMEFTTRFRPTISFKGV